MQWSSWVQTCKTEDQQYSDTSHNSECSLTQVTVSVRLAILKWNPLKYFRSKIFGQNGRSINRPLSRSNTFPESVSSNRQNIRVPKIVDIFFCRSLSLSLFHLSRCSHVRRNVAIEISDFFNSTSRWRRRWRRRQRCRWWQWWSRRWRQRRCLGNCCCVCVILFLHTPTFSLCPYILHFVTLHHLHSLIPLWNSDIPSTETYL